MRKRIAMIIIAILTCLVFATCVYAEDYFVDSFYLQLNQASQYSDTSPLFLKCMTSTTCYSDGDVVLARILYVKNGINYTVTTYDVLPGNYDTCTVQSTIKKNYLFKLERFYSGYPAHAFGIMTTADY